MYDTLKLTVLTALHESKLMLLTLLQIKAKCNLTARLLHIDDLRMLRSNLP